KAYGRDLLKFISRTARFHLCRAKALRTLLPFAWVDKARVERQWRAIADAPFACDWLRIQQTLAASAARASAAARAAAGIERSCASTTAIVVILTMSSTSTPRCNR